MRTRTILAGATAVVVGLGLGIHSAIGSSGQVDSRSAAVARFFGQTPGGVTWRTVSTTDGPKWVGQLPGVGLIQVDQTSGDVDEIIYSSRLNHADTGTISVAVAEARARGFAQDHDLSLGGMQERSAALADHGVFSEYRVTYQARSGQTWLPSSVTIGIDSHSGAVDYFSRRSAPLRVATTAKITQAQAVQEAQRQFGSDGQWLTRSQPELEVQVLASGEQRLVWAVTYEHQHGAGPYIPQQALIWVDALSGIAHVAAAS